ncbi:MAG: cytochrome c family protein [Chloroflexi bacterium]|nr:cytochrome c family protein [Chloroflexota bacterium]
MLTRKLLVILAALLVLSALASIVACAPASPAAPQVVKETVQVPVQQTVVVPQTVVVKQTVPAPAQPTAVAAAQPTAAPKAQPPVAVLKIVPVAGNPADPNAITATIKYVTDTAVGPSTAVANLYSSGSTNEPVGVPIHIAVVAADAKNSGKPTWTLTKPADSKAAIKDPAAMATEFTPDVPGMYRIGVVLKNDAGTSEMEAAQIHAGTYIGVDAGNCKQCHAGMAAEWSKTGHASILKNNIDNTLTPDVASHYSETCIRCHTTGYYPGVANGGFADAQAKANWQFPTLAQINAAGKKTGPSNYDAMPAAVKNMANIQCEDCHGPAKEHVTNGENVMAVSFDNGVCNQCHAGGGHHVKGLEIVYSKHSDASSMAWTHPTGPAEQACVRCHSGKGYVTFLQNPTNAAAWNTDPQTVGCATCHDPHSDANAHQLRVVGKPVQVPFTAKDVGLSATCEECHNNRTNPADAVKGSYPHYSSAAEMLSDTGGVTYGQTIKDSPHAMLVGAAVMPDPSDKTGQTKLFGGDVPGPCVACHMYPGLGDTKDANYMKVGGHSFNMVSPDGKFDYGAACKSCHGDVKDFNIKAKADYDGNGKVEGVQDEVKGLLNVLWKALEAKGLKKLDTGYPYATVPQNADGTTDPKIANAWYNYRYVYGTMWGSAGPGNEGKAAAIHNFDRAVQLLQLSYKDLTGQDVPNATVLK